MVEIKKHLDKMGYKATDVITGEKGVITSVAFDLYGCIQAILTTEAKNGKESVSKWYDIARLKITSSKPVMLQPNFEFGLVAEGKKGGFEKPIL